MSHPRIGIACPTQQRQYAPRSLTEAFGPGARLDQPQAKTWLTPAQTGLLAFAVAGGLVVLARFGVL